MDGVGGDARKGVDWGREQGRERKTEIESRTGRWQEVRERKRDRGRQLEFWRCSTAVEGELPRTRGPNPLFWTHTPASRLSAPTTCNISSLHRVLPTTAFPASAATSTPFHPERQTRHIARSVALLPSEAPRRSILYNYPACITKVAAKLFLPFALACNATPSPLRSSSSSSSKLHPFTPYANGRDRSINSPALPAIH